MAVLCFTTKRTSKLVRRANMILTNRTKDAYPFTRFRRTGFARSRINYYFNSCASFNYELLCLCGDISSNPGPEYLHRNCAICGRVKAKNHRAITCGSCYHPTHFKCNGLTPIELKQFQARGNYYWTCPPCA